MAYNPDFLTAAHLALAGQAFRRDWAEAASRHGPEFMDGLAAARNIIVSRAYTWRDGSIGYMRGRCLWRPPQGAGNDFHDGGWALEEICRAADGRESRQSFRKLEGPLSLPRIRAAMAGFEGFNAHNRFPRARNPERWAWIEGEPLDRHVDSVLKRVFDALDENGYAPGPRGAPRPPAPGGHQLALRFGQPAPFTNRA
jgi:hypothetical protein